MEFENELHWVSIFVGYSILVFILFKSSIYILFNSILVTIGPSNLRNSLPTQGHNLFNIYYYKSKCIDT